MEEFLAVIAAWLPVVIIAVAVFSGVVISIAVTLIIRTMHGIFNKDKHTNDWF